MANVNWVQNSIYVVILSEDEERMLLNRSNKDLAYSAFLGRIITAGLSLAERIEYVEKVPKEDVK